MPNWAWQPAWTLANYFDEIHMILSISVQGSRMVQDFPEFLDIIGEAKQEPDKPLDPGKMSLAEIKARSQFAENEAKKGHPIIHAHALVSQWSAFEIFVEDLGVAFLMNKPELLKREVFAKIKIPLAEFELMDKDERCRQLFSEALRQNGRRYGVDHYERLLEPIGLSGEADDETKKVLRAYHHVRNLIVHRGSVVDRRVVEACPWIGLKIGDRVRITPSSYWNYDKHLWKYALLIVRRLREMFPPPVKTGIS